MRVKMLVCKSFPDARGSNQNCRLRRKSISFGFIVAVCRMRDKHEIGIYDMEVWCMKSWGGSR